MSIGLRLAEAGLPGASVRHKESIPEPCMRRCQNAGCLAVVSPRSVAYLFRNISYCQNRYRIICRTDVYHRNEGGDRKFGSTLAVYVGCNLVDDEIDSAVSRMISSIPPAIMAMIMSSPMPIMPLPMAENQRQRGRSFRRHPEDDCLCRWRHRVGVLRVRTAITFMPQ